MPHVRELAIEVQYEKHEDGRYFLSSLDVPGLRLVGPDLDALQGDLDEVVTDLLFHNSGITVENLRWVPGPAEVKRQLDQPQFEGTVRYIANIKAAA